MKDYYLKIHVSGRNDKMTVNDKIILHTDDDTSLSDVKKQFLKMHDQLDNGGYGEERHSTTLIGEVCKMNGWTWEYLQTELISLPSHGIWHKGDTWEGVCT